MSPREMIEAAMASSVMEIIQLRRTLWLVLQKTGPITINDADCHPLWRMKATRGEAGVTLTAEQLEEPSSHQISQLAEALDGTMTPLADAMQKTDLRDHPAPYIEMLLQSRVVMADSGYWVDATLAKIAQSPPSDAN